MDINGLVVFFLVLVRVGCVFAFLPFLGEGLTPKVIKALFVLVLSVLLYPMGVAQLPTTPTQPLEFFLFVAAEATFGVLMGLSGWMNGVCTWSGNWTWLPGIPICIMSTRQTLPRIIIL